MPGPSAEDLRSRLDVTTRIRKADPTAVATGVVAGVAIPLVQFLVLTATPDGPLAVGGSDLQVEMALFVAIGVVVPAGGIALALADSVVAGAGSLVVYPLGAALVGAVFGMPAWLPQAVLGAYLVLGVALLLDRRAGATREEAGAD